MKKMQIELGKLQRVDFNTGSALIMTVVVTVLLAVVGIMFVMSARVDNIATSYISENRELYAAVDAVIEDICRQLMEDVPGVPGQEYYDYPGDNDRWLASLEPYENSGIYYWRHITDLYGNLSASDVPIEIVPDGNEIDLINPDDEHSDLVVDQPADADGDGVSDSKWIRLNGIMTSKGRPIFAAVRIIDNGGMLNVNTGYKFNPNGEPGEVDGSSLMQIGLMALSWRPGDATYDANDKTDEINLKEERCNYGAGGIDIDDLAAYERDVVWQYYEPNGLYTPFDISDELELRYRFILNQDEIDTRAEFWGGEYHSDDLTVPRDENQHSLGDPCDWYWYVNLCFPDPNKYAYRHIATTYSMDRIINPNGDKMVNINDSDEVSLYNALNETLDANEAAQIAANLIDFRDSDSDIKSFDPNLPSGKIFYGFERPCVYISELAHNFKTVFVPGGVGPEPGIQQMTHRSYAIELHKPYSEDIYPDINHWRLSIPNYAESPVSVEWSGSQGFHVIYFEDPCVPLEVSFDDPDPSLDGSEQKPPYVDDYRYSEVFKLGDIIELQRLVGDVNDPSSEWITIDAIDVPEPNPINGWLTSDEEGVTRSIERDITQHKCIRHLWESGAEAGDTTLGQDNDYTSGDPEMIQAHPANRSFTNVGEIGLLFREDVYGRTWSSTDTEADVRVDLTDPNYQQLFNYLTVFDPSKDLINNDGDERTQLNPNGLIDEDDLNRTPEWKIPGRININTTPWFVLAQLPWVTNPTLNQDDPGRYKLAQAIVAYRDKLNLSGVGGPDYSGPMGRGSATGISNIREELGFESIGELNFVIGGSDYNYRIDYYIDGSDQDGFPDLTPVAGGDDAADDFEERDLIFTRLSNLVTVRSDVFTAYILVRIGTNGPQKRVIAILDRSNVYYDNNRNEIVGNVRIVAWHPVADPR